ncbi:MAG TPA: DUF1957 domain-containing protein [bacterium]|nr:DUF1957 domain-containing protein [bacterium]
MTTGYVMPVLHAHLPFIHHPEHPDFLEEDWLFEALTETYIPLLRMGEKLRRAGRTHALTMSLTPPLCEMLANPLLQKRYQAHLVKLHELADKEVARTAGGEARVHATARMYRRNFALALELWRGCRGNILRDFRRLQDANVLEIITCGATHGFLPYMFTPTAVYAQVEIACRNYAKHFGRRPRGIWLPECGYYPGLDAVLKQCGLRYFFLDTHGILLGEPRPRYGNYAPVACPTGVLAFARDAESSKQVWSAQEGYPGDFRYREFYRDLGYDAPYEYIKPYLHADGIRRNTGLKYHRITAANCGLGKKDWYDPPAAQAATEVHAANFMFNRQEQARHWHSELGIPPVIVCLYDVELFGHWWFEGPLFLEHFLTMVPTLQKEIETITPGEYLRRHQRHQIVTPSYSSWGDKGYGEVWLNGTNDWLYRHLHQAETRMQELARRFTRPGTVQRRALNQAARELLLAQASDWAFILTNKTAVPYAMKRTREHVHRFTRLYQQLKHGVIDRGFLADCEWKDCLFREIDYRVYR